MSDRRKTPLEDEDIRPQACSVDLRLEILGQVPFFAGLSPESVSSINQLFHEHGYLSGEMIYLSGDPAKRLYVVAAGKVKLLRHTLKGKDVLLDILQPGEFFGSLSALGDDEYTETAQAQTDACILGIDSDSFRKILDSHPRVALKVLDTMAERLKSAQEMVRQLSVHSVERRIAYTLLKLGEKLGQEGEVGLLIQVPLSREDLAQMTGMSPETASRVLSQFQKDGLIESGRQWISIINKEALEAIAQEGL